MRQFFLAAALVAASVPAWAADLEVVDPYVRAMPPGSATSAAYLMLRNRGEEERRLVAVRSPAAARVEVHGHSDEGGMARMRKVDEVVVAPNAQVHLAPGGLHIMLMQLQGSLKAGEHVALELEFADGETLQVQAEVRRIGHGEGKAKRHAH